MQGETESANPHAPLPPVTTRWRSPESRLDDSSSALAPPYLPGAETDQRRINTAPSLSDRPIHVPPPVVRMFDSTPTEQEAARTAEPAEAEGTAESGAVAETPSPAETDDAAAAFVEDEGPMPWEEYALHTQEPADSPVPSVAHEPGPALTSDAEVSGDARALEDWEQSLEGEGGEAVPAWGDERSAEEVAFAAPPRLDDEGSVIPEAVVADQVFPMDAFIIPPHSKRLPKGLEHSEAVQGEIAEELAFRLDVMAERLRTEGFPGLLVLDANHRPVDTLLAGVLAGYLAHETEELEAEGPQ